MAHLKFDKAHDALTQLLAFREDYDSAAQIVEWAGLAIEQGEHSQSLAMLAGLGPDPNAFETDQLFKAARRELNYDEGTAQQRRTEYLILVCTGIADGSLDADAGLAELLRIWQRDYADDLTFVVKLSDDIYRLDQGEPLLFDLDLRPDTVTTAIREAARRWLKR